MKEKLTEMIFILDKSGSMSGLESDTIGGFNAMIEKQKDLEGQARVSTVLFNHNINILHDREDIQDIKAMTKFDYRPSGMTALLDAIGSSIKHIKEIYTDSLREERPEKVIFVITTDGLENSSKEYNYRDIKELISFTQEKYEWEYIFLGANIDAIHEASKFGIRADRAARYHSDKRGTELNYHSLNEAITSFRKESRLDNHWKKDIDSDYKNRK
ncbi:MAG: hypothetical protein AB7E09_05980 [Candidatus Izemoplasmatales bacterium]